MGAVFFHIDLDAFFASVEILDHPEYKGKPLIIGIPGPRNVASTCSYEARKYGVHSAMPMTTALRLCPDAICIPGRHERYSIKSKEVMEIIKTFAPGFIQTDMTDTLSEEIKENAKSRIALGRFGKPEEIAEAVAFLASDKASYITGQVLSVDGCTAL